MTQSRSIRTSARLAAMAAGLLVSAAAFAQVTVQDAWVRGTVPGQTSSGAFMTLQSADGAKVVGVSTPVAGTAEIHEMKMDGNVMRMKALPSLDLPKGQAVQLKPGGYHVMLMDLKQPLVKDTVVPITLKVELADKRVVEQKVEAKVRDLTAGNMPAMNHGGEHKH
ncbi:membrane protein [Ralstonia sp. A12]|uniref:copper chaperone PCu(A)C n=1 Tax=Ralstonia sp. A12 TaxID=1217052 RepID=UPI000574D785|nr:copper chaperone PCu(A)C [Ralstonia sp. A12]KHK57241.1 membrane protein [Ralstonia sp. A12]